MLWLGVLRIPLSKTKRVPCQFPFKQVKVSVASPFVTLPTVLIYIEMVQRPRRVSGCVTRAAVAEVPMNPMEISHLIRLNTPFQNYSLKDHFFSYRTLIIILKKWKLSGCDKKKAIQAENI